MARNIEDYDRVDCFHPRQVWQSPKGTYYRVLDVRVNGKATLGQGLDGRGKQVTRDWDAVAGGWTLYQDAVAQEYTARLFVPHASDPREAYELQRDSDGYYEGFVTIDYRTRVYSTGLVDPNHSRTAKADRPYKGRGWQDDIRRDALNHLCAAVGVDPERVRVVDGGLAGSKAPADAQSAEPGMGM